MPIIYGGKGRFVPSIGGGAFPKWWLSGSIPAANCIAAYQPKGAASYAASKVNLANPGTYNATDGAAFPSWDTAVGWTFAKASVQYLAAGFSASLKPFTFIAAVNFPQDLGANRVILGGSGWSCIEFGIVKSNYKLWLNKSGAAVIGTSTAGLTKNILQVAAVSYSATGVYQFYLNGAPEATATVNETFTARTGIIGAANGGAAEPFDGIMTAISYYDTVLTDAQVLAVRNAAILL
jgi:hypothetical protein